MYTDLLRDFSKRTLANVRCLQRQHDSPWLDEDAERPAMVTARLGAFLSIMVILRSKIGQVQRDHPEALNTLAQSLI